MLGRITHAAPISHQCRGEDRRHKATVPHEGTGHRADPQPAADPHDKVGAAYGRSACGAYGGARCSSLPTLGWVPKALAAS